MSAAPEPTQRLFFALWPDPPVRRQLAELAQCVCKHPLADAKLHMTLVFLGSTTAQERQCFSRMASKVHGEPFELLLDFIGVWPRPGIQWLGGSHPPRVLIEFVDRLQTALAGCGFEAEKRRFVPHITLARRVRHPKVKGEVDAIHWRVNEFALVESLSEQGAVSYRVVERWPLADSA